MTNKFIVEIERESMPERKPYADRVYIATYTFSGGYGGEWTPEKDTVLGYVRADFGIDFYPYREGVGPGPYLKSLEQLVENKWKAVIVEPYYD
jgi:hypothetical protein